MSTNHWVYNVSSSLLMNVLLRVFKEGFSCCLKLILVCLSLVLFCRHTHKMSFPAFYISFFFFVNFFFLIVGHLTSYDSCNMHVSPRSNGQSPLWLPTPNHSSRPSRVLFVSLCLSLSPFSSSLYVYSIFSFISWVFVLIVFLTCCVYLSLSVLWSIM